MTYLLKQADIDGELVYELGKLAFLLECLELPDVPHEGYAAAWAAILAPVIEQAHECWLLGQLAKFHDRALRPLSPQQLDDLLDGIGTIPTDDELREAETAEAMGKVKP